MPISVTTLVDIREQIALMATSTATVTALTAAPGLSDRSTAPKVTHLIETATLLLTDNS